MKLQMQSPVIIDTEENLTDEQLMIVSLVEVCHQLNSKANRWKYLAYFTIVCLAVMSWKVVA